jgi:hypothetical protein
MTVDPLTTLRSAAVLPLVALAALVGCHGTPPGTLVGESQHFRLYVDPDATVPEGFAGPSGLAAPEGKITYYWLSPDHVAAACQELEATAAACFWPGSMEIDAPTLPQPHELNHAYMYLQSQHFPIPFLAEGVAEAIACGDDLSFPNEDVPWEEAVVAYPPSPDPYGEGGAFVRYLLRTYGSAAFLRYYDQAPEQRDPAVFAANFQSFWGTTMDDAWTSSRAAAESDRYKICPCSLPPLDPTGAVANDPAQAPYWRLPENTAGQTLALGAGAGREVLVRDCAGVREQFLGEHVLMRLDGSEPRYAVAPVEKATLDTYIADACADAAPFSEPIADTEVSFLTIAIPSPPSGSSTVYLNLASSFSGTLNGGLTQICSTCAFDQGSCQPLAAEAQPKVQGPLFGRATFETPPVQPPLDMLDQDIEILGQ